LSQRELSHRAGWHESKTSRIENANAEPRESDAIIWCQVCSAEHVIPELVAELRAAALMWLDWRRAERSGLTQLNVAVREIYERTKIFRSYGAFLIPGLLQTREYATAVLDSLRLRREVPVNDVAEAVEERMARQHILYEGDHRFAFVLESATLRYKVGGSAVLGAQLRHLLKVMSLPSLSISVIPFAIDRTERWAVESFYVHDQLQANVELVSGFLTITNPREIHMYLETFTTLSRLAVTGKAARRLISEALSDLE
jgi:hypothetical protein